MPAIACPAGCGHVTQTGYTLKPNQVTLKSNRSSYKSNQT